ncbi:MAG: hypothetical protein WCP85_08285 [Mariniphaga sp.]
MKNRFLFLFLVFTIFSSVNSQSQNLANFPMLNKRVIDAKLREIRISLQLDQATFDHFRPVYEKYESEVSEIDFKKLNKLLKVDAESLTSDEADRLILHQIEIAKRMLEVREKYYKEFKTVLSPQQIIKLYQTEAELRIKVMQELKNRIQR